MVSGITRQVTVVTMFLTALVTAGWSATLQSGDGLALELSEGGAVTSLRIGQTALPLKQPGGFAIADFTDQPEPVNLVPNPGFEEGAAGWSLAPGQVLDDAVAHGPGRSARIDVPGPEPASSSLGVTVPVKPNTLYRAELWYRRHGAGVCGAYLSERDDRNKLTGAQTQVGRAIPKQDDTWHKLSWELRTQPATTRLNLRGDIYRSTGTIWLDDFFIAEAPAVVYRPVAGTVEQLDGAATLRGGVADLGLELTATLRGTAEALRIDGVVRDVTGRDRAVGVRFGLPLDATGWTWYGDPEESEPVEPEGRYRRTYRCESGIGECSIYPWSALAGPEAGLTLALPLSQGPRVFVIEHDQRAPLTSLTFYFGLSSAAERNPSRAPFSFVIYRHDPAWGMRSAMERYYRLFPESFVKRPPFEGYLNYANLERYDPSTHQLLAYRTPFKDASDFGEGYRFLWHMHGCYDFRMVPYDQPTRPDDETVMALLDEMVEQERDKPRYYVPTAETIKKLTYDADGRIRYIGDTRYWRPQEGYNHTDQPGWGLNFRVDEDPGVSGYIAEFTRRKLEEHAEDPARRPFDACLTADAIEGYMGNARGLDYRREHFRTTTVPLTFGKASLKVALPNTIYDLLSQVWWPLTERYQVATYGNANQYEQAFTMPFVDVPMIEFHWDRAHPGRFERYVRAIAHHKIWRYWRVLGNGEKDPESVRRHFANGLAYAIYPCVGALHANGGDLESYRDLYRQYVPAIEELSLAGWEPVPYARAAGGVVIERYGAYADGELHFTLRNYAEEDRAVSLELEIEALGIPAGAPLLAADIVPGQPAPRPIDAATWRVNVPGNGSRAFWIGTTEQLAGHGFRLAERTLGKIERLFAAELDDSTRTRIRDGRALAQRGAEATGDEALRVASELRESAAALAGEIETGGPIDLAKLLFRLRTDLSYVPTAMLGIEVEFPRVVEGGLRGTRVKVAGKVTGPGAGELRAAVRSPWPELGEASRVELSADGRLSATLAVPADPPRLLLPYLIQVTGRARGLPFTNAVPVDLKVADPLAVAALPERVFRGQATRVEIVVTNGLPDRVAAQLTLTPTGEARVEPAELGLTVPPGGSARRPLTVTLPANARLGELYIPFEVTAPAAAKMTGRILLRVGDPVPRVGIRRAPGPPRIDADLSEPTWQGEPTVPALTLLQGGKPATERTAVWLAYDDAGLYVAIRCWESQMERLRADLTERGAPLYREDDVEIFLLPPGALRAYQLAVNALGTRSDNFGNDRDWLAAARREADGWTVEVFVPYAVVGVEGAPSPGSSWACQFGRQQKAKGETSAWTPGRAFNVPEGFGEVVFE